MFNSKNNWLNLRQGAVFILLLVLVVLNNLYNRNDAAPSKEKAASQIEQAFEQRLDHIQVQGSGIVIKILPDDLQGSRHQRFLVRAGESLTLLISHNIDLAPRINTIKAGEDISFSGEYIWNSKGGLIHWTHHDPAKRHPDGWLQYQGRIFK